MELITDSYFNTTTQATIDSGTLTVSNLMSRDLNFQYQSDDFDDDNTTTTITIAFDSTTSISRIALMGHNLKDYTLYYNGATANTFSLTSTGATTTTDFSSNSETSQYFIATAVNCTSVSLEMSATMVANSEKIVGFLHLGASLLTFDRNPKSSNYKPKVMPEQRVHKMSDGGTRINTLAEKFGAQVKYKFMGLAERNNLFSIWQDHTTMGFVPFGTDTGWDKRFARVVWKGSFDFYTYSDDAAQSGFSGTLNLEEIS